MFPMFKIFIISKNYLSKSIYLFKKFIEHFRILFQDRDVKRLSLWSLGIILFIIIISLFMTASLDAYSLAELLLVFLYAVIIKSIKPFLIRKWRFFQNKPSAPYILGFMILLLLCPFFIILNYEQIAEQIANIAYFLLVFGVVIELIDQLKKGKLSKKESD